MFSLYLAATQNSAISRAVWGEKRKEKKRKWEKINLPVLPSRLFQFGIGGFMTGERKKKKPAWSKRFSVCLMVRELKCAVKYHFRKLGLLSCWCRSQSKNAGGLTPAIPQHSDSVFNYCNTLKLPHSPPFSQLYFSSRTFVGKPYALNYPEHRS